jgi:hypothetical protein
MTVPVLYYLSEGGGTKTLPPVNEDFVPSAN